MEQSARGFICIAIGTKGSPPVDTVTKASRLGASWRGQTPGTPSGRPSGFMHCLGIRSIASLPDQPTMSTSHVCNVTIGG
jgi:hypothetical protein